MHAQQLNLGATSFTNINKMSLHDGDPGNTGENDSGETHQTITWSTPAAGYMRALCTFSDVSGTFPYVGFWDDDMFITAKPLGVTLPSAQPLTVYAEFQSKESL